MRRNPVFAVLGVALLVGAGWGVSRYLSHGQWLAVLAVAWLAVLFLAWPRRQKRTGPASIESVAKLGLVLTSVFAILALQLARIQAWEQERIVTRIARDEETGEVAANPRLINEDLRIDRGRILARDGSVIAETVIDDGLAHRRYPDPATAYVAGYFSPLLYGKFGLEATYDAELRGEAEVSAWTRWQDILLHRPPRGLDLWLTLDSSLQRYAHELLGDRTGAVVLIDVETGAIVALASNPHFDPEALVTTTAEERDAAAAYWQSLLDDSDRPLLLRATQGLYTPGSTFKTVVAAAAIDAGIATPDEVYRDDGLLDVEGHVIIEANRPDDTIEMWSLRDALAFSLNVVFAQVGLELGANLLWHYAEQFGFGQEIPFDLPVARGQVASSKEFLESAPAIADTGFGQGQLLATPLQMAMVAAAIANDGAMMRPYLVERVVTRDGETRSETRPRVWRQVVSEETAREVRDMMIHAVTNGYAYGAAIDGLVVGGKTGTAETGDGDPHAWFIGFVGDPEPRYAVAVVLEHGGTGLSGPLAIAREMLAAAMAQRA